MTYPPRFGLKITRLHEQFLCKKAPLPPVPDRVQRTSVQELFASLDWDDLWDDAEMTSVLKYLMGNYGLDLGHWRDLIPSHL